MPQRKFPQVDLSQAKKSNIPTDVSPMLATLIDGPFDKKGWLFELKWDGYRAVAIVQDSNVKLISRNKISLKEKFAEIVASLSTLNFDAVFDGEVVALDKDGKPRFQYLQNSQEGRGALVYYVFDILYFSGYDLRDLPLVRRKEILKKVLPAFNNVRFSDHLLTEGVSFFNEASKNGLEGIVAKDVNSKYLEGRRSLSWLKIKVKKRQEVVIGGFTKPRGGRKKFGALVLGIYDGDKLIYVGHSGSGFDEESLDFIYKKLEPLIVDKTPFFEKPITNMPATWVTPKLICEVEFSEWTDDGRMRHPIFKGLREDKDAKSIGREKTEIGANPDNNVNLKFSHTDKIYFPKDKLTKGDIIEYYKKIANFMVPYLYDRPHSLYRSPEGIAKKGFYHKDIDFETPPFVSKIPIFSESEDKVVDYMVCKNTETLLYMANLGCIEINPWLSRVASLENPDFMLIDLDPEEIEFAEVVRAALTVREVLESAKINSFVKTSGKTGLHIMIPLRAKYEYDHVKQFAEIIATIVRNKLPKTTSIERSPSKRRGQIYVDYLQNRKGQTMAAAYCVRPINGAPVSTPLKWEEVNNKLDPIKFNINSIFERLEKHGDLLEGLLEGETELEKALEKLKV